MTKVDECTSEDTGVGAAIAAGSQALNGICALLVIAPRITRNNSKEIVFIDSWYIIMFQLPSDKTSAMANNSITSPTRYLKTVSIPALKDF